MKLLTTTVYLTSGAVLAHTVELDQEVFDQVEIFLKKSVTEDSFTAETMAAVMNEMFNQIADDGAKLTRLTVGPHFIFVEHIAATSYEVTDRDEGHR